MLQPFNGTVLFQSGNRIIKGFPGYLKNTISNEYYSNAESIKADIITLINKSIRETSVQSSVRATIQMGDIDGYFIEKNNEIFTIDVIIPHNYLKIWVTTPDLKDFDINIGASQDIDPDFLAKWDIKMSLALIIGNTFDTIYIKNTIAAIQLKIIVKSITGNLLKVIGEKIHEVENILNDKGFLDNLKNLLISENKLTDKLNQHLENIKQSIPEYAHEFSIDGNNTIEAKLNEEGSIIINHPWSQSGYIKRSASENSVTDND